MKKLKALVKKMFPETHGKILKEVFSHVPNPSSGLTAEQEEKVALAIGGRPPYENCVAYEKAAIRFVRARLINQQLNG